MGIKVFPRAGAWAVIEASHLGDVQPAQLAAVKDRVGVLFLDVIVNRKTKAKTTTPQIHIVGADGNTTVAVVNIDWAKVRQARLDEIPPGRRTGAAELGYV
jgi:hypothetical protein